MEPVINFPAPEPELKLARPATEKWAATLAEERLRLHEDMDALREREDNLREYETRLRSLQADIEAGRHSASPHPTFTTLPTRATPSLFHRPSSRTPFTDDPSTIGMFGFLLGLYFILPYWEVSAGEALWSFRRMVRDNFLSYPKGGSIAVPGTYVRLAEARGARGAVRGIRLY